MCDLKRKKKKNELFVQQIQRRNKVQTKNDGWFYIQYKKLDSLLIDNLTVLALPCCTSSLFDIGCESCVLAYIARKTRSKKLSVAVGPAVTLDSDFLFDGRVPLTVTDASGL